MGLMRFKIYQHLNETGLNWFELIWYKVMTWYYNLKTSQNILEHSKEKSDWTTSQKSPDSLKSSDFPGRVCLSLAVLTCPMGADLRRTAAPKRVSCQLAVFLTRFLLFLPLRLFARNRPACQKAMQAHTRWPFLWPCLPGLMALPVWDLRTCIL